MALNDKISKYVFGATYLIISLIFLVFFTRSLFSYGLDCGIKVKVIDMIAFYKWSIMLIAGLLIASTTMYFVSKKEIKDDNDNSPDVYLGFTIYYEILLLLTIITLIIVYHNH